MIQCDMIQDCQAPISHIDNKGFAYCREHGQQRKAYCPCRRLKPAELKRIKAKQPLASY